MAANVYDQPELFGLVLVDSIELSDASYEFDIRAVWRDGEGRHYTARDSGCSCPSPFEDYNAITDLERLTSLDQIRGEWAGARVDLFAWKAFIGKVEASLERTAEEAPVRSIELE